MNEIEHFLKQLSEIEMRYECYKENKNDFNFFNQEISTLDLSTNTKLRTLACCATQLTTLDYRSAPKSAYTIIDGRITFHRTGEYQVTMKNKAITPIWLVAVRNSAINEVISCCTKG